jgi:cation diffusion facilitator family transporter
LSKQSKGTVLLALAANVGVAVAKLAGGLATGSAAMLSEGAHSVADTINELFLLTSLRRSQKQADAKHPFGYGKERFFWSLLAAVGIFVAGAGFSVVEAYRSFSHAEPVGSRYYLTNYVVLAVALVFEGASWLRAIAQVRGEARTAGHNVMQHIRASSDPSVKTVASEDTAAIIGLGLAAGGLLLHQATGASWWEGIASAAVAVLLVVVAITLGRDSKGLLIGEAATPELTAAIQSYLDDECSAIDEVIDLLTMHIGADQVLLAARVDLADDLDSSAVESISADLDAEIQRRWPVVTQVFIDATRAGERTERVGLAPSKAKSPS